MKEAARTQGAFLPPGYLDLFLGNIPGSLGETCKMALLAGARPVAGPARSWTGGRPSPSSAAMAALSAVLGRNPPFDLLSGGRSWAPSSWPPTSSPPRPPRRGAGSSAAACGLLTFLIRAYGGFPEGVCYAILFMNCLNPLIEQYVRPRRFGARGLRKEAVPMSGSLRLAGRAVPGLRHRRGQPVLRERGHQGPDRRVRPPGEDRGHAEGAAPGRRSSCEAAPRDGIWEARAGGQLVGRVLAASTQGYSGPIQGLVGLDAAGR